MIGFFKAVTSIVDPLHLPDRGLAPHPVPGFPGYNVMVRAKATRGRHRPHRLLIDCPCGRVVSLGRLPRHKKACKS